MNKFRAVRTFASGVWFHSKGEAARWSELKLLERAGEITELDRQVPYELNVKGERVGTYIADFVYVETETGFVVEDFKGVRTAEYRIKAKLMKAIYGITIRETGRKSRPPKPAKRAA